MTPSRHHRTRALLGACLLSVAVPTGCTAASQDPVAYDAVVVPDPDPRAEAGAWTVRLTRADFAFGPVYFCASASGSATLCEASIAEVASSGRFDALSGDAQPLGKVHGYSGTIRSAAWDYGISWFETQAEPTPSDVAPGGHSMHLEGEATSNSRVVRFVADVDVVPQYQGQTAVATAPASATVDSSAFRLEVHLHAADWLRQVDFDALAAEISSPVQVEPGSRAHNALLVGIENLAPPELLWVPTEER